MTMQSATTKLLAAGLTACFCLTANAHYIWIERDAKSARLYFGEVAEVRERSPGRLDEIRAPEVWSPGSVAPLAAVRGKAYFAIAGELKNQVLARETGYEVKNWSGIGVVKPMFYARHSVWPLDATPAARHLLDIVPVGRRRDTFQVFFDGKPLPKAKVNLYAPNDWMQDHQTGADGTVKLLLPWRGQYVLEVIHKEERAGEFEGRKFDAFRHRAALTVVKSGGIPPKGTGGGASRHAHEPAAPAPKPAVLPGASAR